MTLADLHRHARTRLVEAGVAEPALDARLLVEHFTATGRIDLLRAPERTVEPALVTALESALARRIAGEPVHRILGFREFYGLRLHLSPETLEPRPDTETLVDLALPRVRAIADGKGVCRILDLGTGTGAIALALLSMEPRARATGVDIAPGALATARRNAAALGLADRFETIESNWFDAISGRFDAIVSNPPYIDFEDMQKLDREVASHDPVGALYGGQDGLDAYRRIAAEAFDHLEPGGFVAVEIGSRQKTEVSALFAARGWTLDGAARDLGDRDRALAFLP